MANGESICHVIDDATWPVAGGRCWARLAEVAKIATSVANQRTNEPANQQTRLITVTPSARNNLCDTQRSVVAMSTHYHEIQQACYRLMQCCCCSCARLTERCWADKCETRSASCGFPFTLFMAQLHLHADHCRLVSVVLSNNTIYLPVAITVPF